MREPAARWTAESIPAPLAAILDEQAGKVHSAGGAVRRCLADILNAYDEWRDDAACALAEEALAAEADQAETVAAFMPLQMDAIAAREDGDETKPVTVVEFPPSWTDEQIAAFKENWDGGPLTCRRKGDLEPVRVTAKWFTPGGALVDCDCRETTRGEELDALLAAWSQRPLPTWIYIKPIGGDDA